MTQGNKELLIITDETALEAFSKDDGVKTILDDAVKQAEELKKDADLSTDKGRKQIATNARKFATLKTRLDAIGKGSTDDMRATINAVNANRNQVKSKLDELRDEVRQPLTDWEDTEKQRCFNLELRIKRIIHLGSSECPHQGYKLNINELKENLADLDIMTIDEWFEEYELEARKMHEKSREAVIKLITNEEKRLAEQAELDKLRKEKEEREAKEKQDAHDLKIKHEAEQKALEESERVRKEQEAKQRQIEQEKQDAIKREEQAKLDAENAKREKIEAEERAKAQAKIAEENRLKAIQQADLDKKKAVENARIEEQKWAKREQEKARLAQEKLEADKAHTGKILKQAKESLMKFVDEKTAKLIIKAIAKKEVENISINY